MDPTTLGRVLVIANPAAQAGRCAEAARHVERFLEDYEHLHEGFELRLTEGPGDASRIAREASGVDTVCVVGGDGVIHETVGGLMERADGLGVRPRLAIIPMGSGNDYARTLGIVRNDPERALTQLVDSQSCVIDLGRVNGTWFCETCSFGLDSAIAFDTVERRTRTNATGTLLFAQSGISVFVNHTRGWDFEVELRGARTMDGELVGTEVIGGEEIVFACQVGPTYGGGFEVCPTASPTDGLLDVCLSTSFPAKPRTLALFALARFGRHTRAPELEMRRVEGLTVRFREAPPCQVDGELLSGETVFEVESVPHALEVVVPAGWDWPRT